MAHDPTCKGCEVLRELLPDIEFVLCSARERECWSRVDAVIERIRKERLAAAGI